MPAPNPRPQRTRRVTILARALSSQALDVLALRPYLLEQLMSDRCVVGPGRCPNPGVLPAYTTGGPERVCVAHLALRLAVLTGAVSSWEAADLHRRILATGTMLDDLSPFLKPSS